MSIKVVEPTPKPVGRRLALLICNGTFLPNMPQLPGAAQDAKNLEAALSDPETCRFSVRALVDRGLLEVRREIARICRDASAEDTLLIHYSGQCRKDVDGSLYLIVADSERDYLDATALDAEFVLSRLRLSTCRRTILLVDGCYAGAFFANNRGIPNGLYAITSCGAEESSWETPAGGAFTLALCAGLRHAAADVDGDGRVSIDELHQFVEERLRADGRSGTPQKWVWNVREPIYIANAPRHIFLSYSREDLTAVDELAQAIDYEGLSVWIDREGIQSGNWKERVAEGLNRARAVVVFLTPSALGSRAVRKELAFAARKNIPIIPVQVRDIPDDLLPDWFTLDYGELHRHILDSGQYVATVKKLALAIHKLRRTQPNTAATVDGSMILET